MTLNDLAGVILGLGGGVFCSVFMFRNALKTGAFAIVHGPRHRETKHAAWIALGWFLLAASFFFEAGLWIALP